VIDLADGDAAKGNVLVGSPLATALASRGSARIRLGRAGWRDDFDRALALARGADPLAQAIVVTYKNLPAIPNGVLGVDDDALREIEDALHIADSSVGDVPLGLARLTMGVALAHRDSSTDHARGLQLLGQVREMCSQERFYAVHLPVVDLYTARERSTAGDFDAALPVLRDALGKLFDNEQLSWFVPGTATLVEALLALGGDEDVAEAAAAINRLAAAPADDGIVMRDIMLLRLRGLLARARGEEVEYQGLRGRYRAMANSLGFEGHTVWVEMMP